MKMQTWRFCMGIALALAIVTFCASEDFRQVYALPSEMRVMQGDSALFRVNYPLTVDVDAVGSLHLKTGGTNDFFSRPVSVEPVNLGEATVDFKLLGLIPIKQVKVDVTPPVRVIPGGQSIGVVMRSNGVLVVGSSPVVDEQGRSSNPSETAGIEVGDTIEEIDRTRVNSDIEVAELIDASGREGREAHVIFRHGDQVKEVKIRPILCRDTERYRIGLFVRDRAVGVGTLTFLDPATGSYGALGHVISDADTNRPVECKDGKVVPATVSGIHSGKIGHPGEKIGTFIEEDQILGNIEKNTEFGIYGKASPNAAKCVDGEPMEVASMNQIEPGYAEMLTVVDGQTVERFAVSIEKINLQENPEGKGLVVKVTDERLISKTGGIIQGMSGSPLVQNGRLIGAVTHVFVHDPTKGYGCFMDWMLMEGGVIPNKKASTVPKLFSKASDLAA